MTAEELHCSRHDSKLAASLSVLFSDTTSYRGPSTLGDDHGVNCPGDSPGQCLQAVLHELTLKAIDATATAGLLAVHAGALFRNGKGVLLPGPSGSGKTTLVIELLRNHAFTFMTDEVAGVSTRDISVTGFARPVNVKTGSQHRWPDLDPALVGLPSLPSGAWLVPSSIGRWPMRLEPAPLSLLVFLERVHTAGTAVSREITPADAAVRLGGETSYLSQIPGALDRLKKVVLAVPAVVVRYDDATDGAAEVSRLSA